MLGIPIANVLGVPGATWLGQHLGWRSAYWMVALIGVATVALMAYAVPHLPRDRTRTVRNELSALTSLQVWLTLGVGAVGFGGMFAMYSYIAPTVTEVTGLPASAVPIFLLVFGASGFVGNLVGGRLGDWSVIRSVVIGMAGLGIGLALFALAAPYAVAALVVLFLVGVLTAVLVINLQLRLMQVAGTAQTLAAASNHAALNVANALGAYLGGLVIAAGWGYTAPSWVGVGLAVLGLGILAVSLLVHRRDHPDRATLRPVGLAGDVARRRDRRQGHLSAAGGHPASVGWWHAEHRHVPGRGRRRPGPARPPRQAQRADPRHARGPRDHRPGACPATAPCAGW